MRMSGAKLVSEPCQSAKTRFGVLHGPLGSLEKLIHVGSASLDAAPPGQSPGPVEPSQVWPSRQQSHVPTVAFASDDVKYITYSPVGARAIIGSWEKTPHTAASRV